MLYNAIVTLHLLCAITFIGVVFFEVILLEGMRKPLGDELMEKVETSLIGRARKVMPWIVATLFVSGGYLFSSHFNALEMSWNNSFTVLLSIKILLALSVLVHFVTAIRASLTGCMTSRRFQITHISVAIHMLLIVILAKAMFYINW